MSTAFQSAERMEQLLLGVNVDPAETTSITAITGNNCMVRVTAHGFAALIEALVQPDGSEVEGVVVHEHEGKHWAGIDLDDDGFFTVTCWAPGEELQRLVPAAFARLLEKQALLPAPF